MMIFRTGPGTAKTTSREPVSEVGEASPPSVPEPAVRAQLARVLASETFRYSERLSSFLKFVVEQQLAGRGSGLKESVLAVEIFDREASYDPRVDSVVRVEARRLREKLARYYEEEGAQDPVGISLPKGSYAPAFTRRAGAETPSVPPACPPEALPHTSLKAIVLVAAVSVFSTLAVTRFFAPSRNPAPPVQRLTSDSGLTFEPVLSPDGKLVAYSSDRGGGGHMDIWVQQIPDGSPRRLTENAADDLDPAFSPNGTLVAYRAEGESDGVYVVPALGGASTLAARGGYRPRFSPDGKHIAFWTGERMFWTAKIFIVPSTGGTAIPFQPEFRYAAYPVWSPDGNHILFVGSKSTRVNYWAADADDADWWIAPVAGGPAVRTSAARIFEQQELQAPRTRWSHRRILPYYWNSSGVVAFSARTGEQTNVWGIRISGDWRASGPAVPLTFGSGRQDHPSMSLSGALVYSVLTHKADIWSLTLDPNRTEPRGRAERLTVDAANYRNPVTSRDGSRLAFLSNRNGNFDVWVRDLGSGVEKALTSSRQDESSAVLSADGSKVAFGYYPPVKESVFVAPFAGGGRVELCADCGEPRAWLPDGTSLLYQHISPAGRSYIGLLDRSGRAVPLVQSTESALFSPSVSRDGKWLALVVRRPNQHRLMLAPLRNGSVAPEAEWVTITEDGPWFDKPRWSPDGNILYYISDRDGFVCIWASRLDPVTRKPKGAPIPIAHFHGGRHSLRTLYGFELSVAEDKLVFNLGEDSRNIWLAPPS